ncbi:MAG TPA: hypothetical protein VGE26_05800 [Sphingobacteriaceae bacterium]
MKLIFKLVMILVLAFPAFAQSQERSKKHGEIEAIKAAFITKKLDLTADEAKEFWPVYNAYQKELSALFRQKRQNIRNADGNPSQRLSVDLDFDGQILNVKKNYRKEFEKILPPQKVLTLYQAEREFREQLIKELRERRHNK